MELHAWTDTPARHPDNQEPTTSLGGTWAYPPVSLRAQDADKLSKPRVLGERERTLGSRSQPRQGDRVPALLPPLPRRSQDAEQDMVQPCCCRLAEP